MIRQRVPFQTSASVPISDPPTARQCVALVQMTPPNEAKLTPVGLGGCWIVQRVPFQRSAIALTEPSGKCCSPTVVHAVVEVQLVDPRNVCTAPGVCGVGVIVHACPSHISASGTVGPFPLGSLVAAPPAMQNDGDWQSTPFSPLNASPAGWGTERTVQ